MGLFDLFKRKNRKGNARVPALILQLESGGPAAREEAASGLGALGREAGTAGDALTAALADEKKQVRLCAADALIKVGGDLQKAMDTLTALLEDTDAEVRRNAAVQIGRSGERAGPAAPALARVLGDREESVVQAAINALLQVGAAAVPALIEVLRSDDDRARHHAVIAVTRIAPMSIPTFVELTGDSDNTLRYIGALGLADLTPAEENLDLVLDALRDDDWLFRAWAASTLRLFGAEVAEAASPCLEAALEDEHPEVKKAAEEALKKIKGTR